MQKEGKNGKGEGPIIEISLSSWARYRQSGYMFRNDAKARSEFLAQQGDAKKADEDARANDEVTRRAREVGSGTEPAVDDGEVVSMNNTKPEILAHLETLGIEADEAFTKAELLELVESAADDD